MKDRNAGIKRSKDEKGGEGKKSGKKRGRERGKEKERERERIPKQ